MRPNAQKPRLLIVDDEADLRELIAEQVGDERYEIQLADNGLNALEAILAGVRNGNPIDVVLSDLNMPKLNGFELLKQVRSNGLDIPFIFLTAYGDREKSAQALKLGASDFLEKPYNAEELVRSVARAAKLGHGSGS